MSHVLCVLGNLLGNRTFSRRLAESLDRLGVAKVTVQFDHDDYRRFPAARPLRLSGPLEVMSVFDQKWNTLTLDQPDAIVVNGWELAVVATRRFPRVPVAVALDTTPQLLREQSVLAAARIPQRFLSRAAEKVYSRLLRRVVALDARWLPMSSWCADSLVEYYGVDRDRIDVTLSPQPTFHQPRAVPSTGPLRAIFVGNDIVRKGGEMLLQILEATSAEELTLDLVSNDPSAPMLFANTRAVVHQGIRDPLQIVERYQDAHILLFPTRRDQFGHVVAEAMACGTVPLVTDVGGVKDLVNHEHTGLVFSLDAAPTEWIAAVRMLASDRSRLNRLSREAFAFARSALSLDRFDQTMRSVMQGLQADTPSLTAIRT